MAEYSYTLAQTVPVRENVLFLEGARCCKKGFIQHRDNSGLFFLKGSSACNKAMYKVTFNANVSVATGGTLEPISLALTINGEQLGNAVAIVTPAAIGDLWNVSLSTFVDVPCGCCVTVSVENTSATTPVTVQNANIIFDRVA